MFPKQKRERKKGKAKANLVDEMFRRDGHSCVICGAWVPDGAPPMHCPDKSKDGNDVIQDVFTGCPPGHGNNCHHDTHFSKEPEVKRGKEQALWWYKDALYCWARDSELCKTCDNPRCECSPVYVQGWVWTPPEKKKAPEGAKKIRHLNNNPDNQVS